MDDILVMSKDNLTIFDNFAIFDSFVKADSVLNSHKTVVVSISGGSDSDLVLDMISKVKCNCKIYYVWFDTGLEYQATKDHLKYLENKYGITIERCKAIKPIPTCCRTFGQPFISKQISGMIERLQSYNFKWEDKPLLDLLEEYCQEAFPVIKTEDDFKKAQARYFFYDNRYWRGCCAALRWWCNEKGDSSRFNIDYNKGLKAFMVANPPNFKISGKCCTYAKKNVGHKFNKDVGADLTVIGVRKAEGGTRSTAYKSCFSDKDGVDEYRPLFWYLNSDKKDYEKLFNITHSKCYSEYGLKRTGCVGCPYGNDFEFELDIVSKYEPKLYAAVNNIFKNSYEYTRKYKLFRADLVKKVSD